MPKLTAGERKRLVALLDRDARFLIIRSTARGDRSRYVPVVQVHAAAEDVRWFAKRFGAQVKRSGRKLFARLAHAAVDEVCRLGARILVANRIQAQALLDLRGTATGSTRAVPSAVLARREELYLKCARANADRDAAAVQAKDHDVATLAYAAGIIDGEGTLYIKRDKRRNQAGEERVSHHVHIAVKMCDEGVLKWLHETFGGGMAPVKHVPGKRPLFRWEIASDRSFAFLMSIRPYMRVKARQADLALDFENLRGRHGRITPDSVVRAREAIYYAIRRLNYGVLNKVAA